MNTRAGRSRARPLDEGRCVAREVYHQRRGGRRRSPRSARNLLEVRRVVPAADEQVDAEGMVRQLPRQRDPFAQGICGDRTLSSSTPRPPAFQPRRRAARARRRRRSRSSRHLSCPSIRTSRRAASPARRGSTPFRDAAQRPLSWPTCAGTFERCTTTIRRRRRGGEDAALQYVRKLSGATKPSKANEAAFARAVDEVTAASTRLLDSLVTQAPPRDREVEAARRRLAPRRASRRE